MKKRVAELLAQDFVTMTATANAEKSLLEIKHEETLYKYRYHYSIRIYTLTVLLSIFGLIITFLSVC